MLGRPPWWTCIAALAAVVLAVLARGGTPLDGDAAGVQVLAHLPAFPVRIVAVTSSEAALAVLVVLLAWALRRSVRPVPFLVTMGGVPVLERIGKAIVHRPRPSVIEEGWGFPSGHAWITMTLAVLVVGGLWPRLRPGQRLGIALLAAVALVVIGVDRVALAAHWPSDVLGGWLFGLAYGMWIEPWVVADSGQGRNDADASRDACGAIQG